MRIVLPTTSMSHIKRYLNESWSVTHICNVGIRVPTFGLSIPPRQFNYRWFLREIPSFTVPLWPVQVNRCKQCDVNFEMPPVTVAPSLLTTSWLVALSLTKRHLPPLCCLPQVLMSLSLPPFQELRNSAIDIYDDCGSNSRTGVMLVNSEHLLN